MLRDTKKHVCAQCGLTFRYPGELEHHKVAHTGEKKFQCTNCPKAYSNWDSFRRHVNNHKVPADKYKCKICGDIFKTRNGLKRHTLHHTGERPHKCPHCPATFTVPSGLRCHLLTHTDEEKLQCPICRKPFKRNAALKQHIQYIHHKQKSLRLLLLPQSIPAETPAQTTHASSPSQGTTKQSTSFDRATR
ncbi:hypothetical protein RP20_CCG004755 [Aedes albopictus]|nr:hypothetical protein RP20_CCG004755 [Aedes albopictus]